MESLPFVAKFEGDVADRHKVPAYDAISALYGFSRSIIIPCHFVLEGKIRHRKITSKKYQLYLQPAQEGSFEALFELLFVGGAVIASNPIATNVTSELITNFVTYSMKKAMGLRLTTKEKLLEQNKIAGSGDLAALAAAVEPALRQAHTIINNGVVNINLVSGTGDSVTLDQSTKHYIYNIHKEAGIQVSLMSVGRYDANSKTGGAFDPQVGRVIPFSIEKNIDKESMRTILQSQSDYALRMYEDNEEKSYVAFQYERIVDINGSVKRIEVLKVRQSIDEL